MVLEKVERRSLPDEVYGQILGELLGGDIGVGEALPSERRLADILGVSRPAVREALQRLAHAGLVDVRQGGSTTVTDFRRSGGLDLLPHLLMAGGSLDLGVARSIMEARLVVGPAVAELAARRRSDAELDAILAARDALHQDADPVGRQVRALAFWSQIVAAAHSVTFQLMFNSLRAAYEPTVEALAGVMAAEVDRLDAYTALTDAIAEADPAAARREAEDLLGLATRSILDVLEQWPDQEEAGDR